MESIMNPPLVKETAVLKKSIRTKFGSIQTFANVCDISYTKLNNFFAGRMKESLSLEFKQEIEKRVQETEFELSLMNEQERQTIRTNIFHKFKNVSCFCKEHDEFSVGFVCQVVNGVRRKKDEKYIKLWEALSA